MQDFPRYTSEDRVQATRWALVRMSELSGPGAEVGRVALQATRGVKDSDSLLVLLETFMKAPEAARPREIAAVAAEAIARMPCLDDQITAGWNVLRALRNVGRIARVAEWCESLGLRSLQRRLMLAVLRSPECTGVAFRVWALEVLEQATGRTGVHEREAAQLAVFLMGELEGFEGELGRLLMGCFADAGSRLAVAVAFLSSAVLPASDRVVRALDAAIFGSYLPLSGARVWRFLGHGSLANVDRCDSLRQAVARLSRTQQQALCA